MKLQYTCRYCGQSHYITSFWRWLITPHLFAKKYIKCKRCGKYHAMARWDNRKWLDWPTER